MRCTKINEDKAMDKEQKRQNVRGRQREKMMRYEPDICIL